MLQSYDERTATGNLKVLIDTNVWFSGILFGGTPEEVIRICRNNYNIVSSDYNIRELLGELKSVSAPYKWRNELERLLKTICLLVEPPDLPAVSRDPKDDPVIAAALAGRCKFLISGDRDLLTLETFQNIQIISPFEFLQFNT